MALQSKLNMLTLARTLLSGGLHFERILYVLTVLAQPIYLYITKEQTSATHAPCNWFIKHIKVIIIIV